MSAPLIEVRDLGVEVDGKQILRSVSLDVCEGEFLAIIGPNGAGKTTLLKCLDRIIAHHAGAIRLAGRDLHHYRPRQLARMMAYVPQATAASIPFTVKQFVLMGRYPHLSPFSPIGPADEEIALAALRLTGTEGFSERLMNTLSGGERQKVFIAASLTQEAKILLLDEPTTFLDPRHQADIHHRLRRINREWGVTVAAVTHDINAALRLADRIVALKGGTVAFSGTPAELMAPGRLEEIFETGFLQLPHPRGGVAVLIEDEALESETQA